MNGKERKKEDLTHSISEGKGKVQEVIQTWVKERNKEENHPHCDSNCPVRASLSRSEIVIKKSKDQKY